MFKVLFLLSTLGLILADLISRIFQCKYTIDAVVQVATDRAFGAACTIEKHLYVGAMQPSCSDYEAQLKLGWQVSHGLQCLFHSYSIFRTWWFFLTVILTVGYIVKLYLSHMFAAPPPTFNIYQQPKGRGFSIAPRIEQIE